MRILHVVDELDPRLGGPPVVATRLATAQSALGHDVHLMSYSSAGLDPTTGDLLGTVPGGDKVHLHRVPQSASAGKASIPAIRRTASAALDGAEFVHLHGVWLPIFPVAAMSARRRGIPYAVAPHGMLSEWAIGQKSVKKMVALALVHRRMLSKAAFIQYLNAEERKRASHMNLQTDDLVVPNGVFLDEYGSLPPAGSFRDSHPEIGQDPYILYLGRLHPLKGLDLLVDAFALLHQELPNVRLVIAGPDAGAAHSLRDQIEKLGLAASIHLVGPQYDQDKYAALGDAMCLSLTSRHEAFSVVIIEALASQLPVVISEECFFPEVAESGAGEVVPLDHSSIAEALIRIAEDPSLQATMGASGRELVEQRYSWSQIAETTVSAYEGAIAASIR